MRGVAGNELTALPFYRAAPSVTDVERSASVANGVATGAVLKFFQVLPRQIYKNPVLASFSELFCLKHLAIAGVSLWHLRMSAASVHPLPLSPIRIRIASRESRLAMAQSEWTAAKLSALFPAATVEIIGMTTKGDQTLDRPLAQIGGKGLFIKELEIAMEEGRADIAVHSMKDMPMTLPSEFAAVIVGEREDVRDAFVSNRYGDIDALPQGATVGTSSLRRESQLRFVRPDLKIEGLRGNVNTRLAKLDAGHYDAIILAAAGLKRLQMVNRIRAYLDCAHFLPAIAQGALGIEYPLHRAEIATWLAAFANADTTAMVTAERAMGRALTASCDVPLGARAVISEGVLHLEGFVAMPNGSRMIRDRISGSPVDAEKLGLALAEKLLAAGAQSVLDSLGRHAG